MEPTVLKGGVQRQVAWYREFVPCEALRDDVYALFSFVPGTALAPSSRLLLREMAFREAAFCTPQIADAQVSIRYELGRTCDSAGRWHEDAHALGGTIVGPLTSVGRTHTLDLSETVGAYFRPGRASRYVVLSLRQLTDTAVPLVDIWRRGAPTPADLAGMSEASRLERLESILIDHRRDEPRRIASLDIDRLAASVQTTAGRATVEDLARAAGVSRQHLTRVFREQIGVGPKLYTRLARFHAVLSYAGTRATIDWAGAAVCLGFADQSHLIAECRRFCGLTPHALASRDWFHPFIERARSMRPITR